jgi:D-lactate dehydrogenase
MKIAVFESEEWEHDACLRLQPEHELVCTRDKLDQNTTPQHVGAETSALSSLRI